MGRLMGRPVRRSSAEFGGGHQRYGTEEPDHRHRRLLGARRERQRRRAADERNELAARHSITSSASNCIEMGIVNPSALAVFMLITSSNFDGRTTGKSPGFSPLRTRPT